MIILVSHNDLDGYSCNVVVRDFYREQDIEEHNLEYSQVSGTLKEILGRMAEGDNLIISDISWDKKETGLTEALERLFLDQRLVVADHHKSSEWIGRTFVSHCDGLQDELTCESKTPNFSNPFHGKMVVTEDKGRCGCEILMDILSSKFHVENANGRLKSLTGYVGEWDLMKWTDDAKDKSNLMFEMPVMLNVACKDNPLQYVKAALEFVSGKGTIENITDPVISIIKKESATIERITDTCRIATLVSNGQQYRYALIYCEDCNNKSLVAEIARQKLKNSNVTGIAFIGLYCDGKDELSLRLYDSEIDLSEIASGTEKGGGGHPFAAGTKVDSKSFKETMLGQPSMNISSKR